MRFFAFVLALLTVSANAKATELNGDDWTMKLRAEGDQNAQNVALSRKKLSLAFMVTTGRTSQPIGHYEYCKVYISDCNIIDKDTRPVRLTEERMTEMVKVNDTINAKVKPMTDLEFYKREELWAYPEDFGDCEDYVLAKRAELMLKGWPVSSLLITVVKQANGDGHAVLTVRTDQGDFVLDNLESRIALWSQRAYEFVKRVSPGHSGQWEKITDNRAVATAATSALKN